MAAPVPASGSEGAAASSEWVAQGRPPSTMGGSDSCSALMHADSSMGGMGVGGGGGGGVEDEDGDLIILDIRGHTFSISASLLALSPETMLGAMFHPTNRTLLRGQARYHFPERDPRVFPSILDFYTSGMLKAPVGVPDAVTYAEWDAWSVEPRLPSVLSPEERAHVRRRADATVAAFLDLVRPALCDTARGLLPSVQFVTHSFGARWCHLASTLVTTLLQCCAECGVPVPDAVTAVHTHGLVAGDGGGGSGGSRTLGDGSGDTDAAAASSLGGGATGMLLGSPASASVAAAAPTLPPGVRTLEAVMSHLSTERWLGCDGSRDGDTCHRLMRNLRRLGDIDGATLTTLTITQHKLTEMYYHSLALSHCRLTQHLLRRQLFRLGFSATITTNVFKLTERPADLITYAAFPSREWTVGWSPTWRGLDGPSCYGAVDGSPGRALEFVVITAEPLLE